MTREATTRRGGRRYFRIAVASALAMVAAAMLLPLTGYVVVGVQDAYAQAAGGGANPRSETWRDVREGDDGYSAVTGRPMPDRAGEAAWVNREAGTLINGSGQNWRQLRNGVVATWGGWLLFAVLILAALFYVINGRVDLEDGRSGRKVRRWSAWERFVHWVTAGSFVILAVTGLSLLFGRVILIPLMGGRGFATWAEIARGLHEFFGPWVFTPGVALMVFMWIAHNLPEKGDLAWFTSGGGILGRKHPSAGRMNAGEKLWFWFIATFGTACVVAGISLAFPVEWGQTRDTMQLMNLIHGATAIAWFALWVGHAYIGTIGSEGSLEAMTTGYVDVNWAKQHHDRWYAEIAETAEHVDVEVEEEERTVARDRQPAAG